MFKGIRIKSASAALVNLVAIFLLSDIVCVAARGDEWTLRGLFGMDSVATKTSEFEDKFDAFSLAFTPDGTRLATGSPNSEEIHVWDWRSSPPRLLQRLSQGGAGSSMNGLRYSPNGELLASAHGRDKDERIVRIWNSSTGAVADDIVDPTSNAYPLIYAGLGFSSDGRFLIRTQMGGSYMKEGIRVTHNSFIVHDTVTWQQVWALSTVPVFVTSFGASHDGHYAVISGQERLERSGDPYLQTKMLLVDLAGKRITRSADIFADFFDVPFVAWSPDDRSFTLGGSPVAAGARLKTAAVETFDAQTGRQLGEYVRDDFSKIRALMYSSDGRYLMIGWDKDVEIWDAAHKKLLQKIAGDVNAASLSLDGRYLAISTGRAVSIWAIKKAPQRNSQ